MLTDVLSACTTNENLILFLTALFSLVSLYVASRQLDKRSDTACINALAELRRQLTTGTNRNVHFMLSLDEDKKTLSNKDILVDEDTKPEEKEKQVMLKEKEFELKTPDNIPMIDVYNYLGTIGLGVNMVREKLIDWETFYRHIGYRIENIFEGESDAHKTVRKHIEDNRSYYPNLRWAHEKIKNKKTLHVNIILIIYKGSRKLYRVGKIKINELCRFCTTK
jgi:hypothetical protein